MPPRPPAPRPADRHYHFLGLIVLALGLLLVVDLLLTAGGNRFVQQLVGQGALPLALLLTLIGGYLALRQWVHAHLGEAWYSEALLGLQLLFLAGITAAHLPLQTAADRAALAGEGGGVIGWALAEALRRGLGDLLAWVVVVIVGLGGLLLVLNYTPLRRLPRPAWQMPALPRPALALLRPRRRPRPAPAAPQPQDAPTSAKPAAMKGDRTPAPRPKKPAKPASPKPAAATAPPAPPAASRRSSKLPPLTLLHGEDSGGANSEQAQIQARIIEDTLASFGIPVEVVETHIGPTVTQFGIAPGTVERAGRLQRIRVNKIVALGDDLALALAASPVRIEAPVPGRPYVGIEVPNADATLVSLRRLLQDKAFRKVGSPLALPMGRDVSGAAIAVDLRRLPHLLIAGATGSGKSVALNAIICALLFNTLPDTLRLILVDPKRVELPGYNGIPHLLAPVVTDAQHAEGALTWLLIEMDERYRRFSEAGARDIDSYNAGARPGDRLPYIVMIIDELADLMVTAAETIEVKLVRLAQMARATGIHLIIATQRPSVDVVTGLIKANFPARLAFAVTSQIDSRVILDTPGADKLLGRGDGLLMTADSAKLRRVQGCFVSDSEIFALVQWWQEHHPGPAPDPTQPRYPWSQLLVEEATKEDMLLQAIEQLRGRQYISASGLQRLLNIGYPRAARLMEQLYEAGVVGEEEDRRTGRPVLLEDEAWEEG